MRWPWRRRPRAATVARQAAEARAAAAEQHVKRPLREMRENNHLAEALLRLLQDPHQ